MFKISRISKITKKQRENRERRKLNRNRKISTSNCQKLKFDRKISFGSMKDELSIESIEDQLQQLQKKSINLETLNETRLKKTSSMSLNSLVSEKESEKMNLENFQISQKCFFFNKQEESTKVIQNIKNFFLPDK